MDVTAVQECIVLLEKAVALEMGGNAETRFAHRVQQIRSRYRPQDYQEAVRRFIVTMIRKAADMQSIIVNQL